MTSVKLCPEQFHLSFCKRVSLFQGCLGCQPTLCQTLHLVSQWAATYCNTVFQPYRFFIPVKIALQNALNWDPKCAHVLVLFHYVLKSSLTA